MKKYKKSYLITAFVMIICTLSIIVACIILPNLKTPSENEGKESCPVYNFPYEDVICINYGDEVSLAPLNEMLGLTYSATDEDIISISQSGQVKTKKCGETEVIIRNGTKVIKTTTVKVNFKYEITNTFNCSFMQNKIFLSSSSAAFCLSIVNSNGEQIDHVERMEVSATEQIDAKVKLGTIWVEAETDGQIFISFPFVEYMQGFDIIVKKT